MWAEAVYQLMVSHHVFLMQRLIPMFLTMQNLHLFIPSKVYVILL